MARPKEKTFTGKAGFILASVGAAIGLGAIWKFPYMAGAEGGAAFLIPYIFFSFTLAFGLLLAEITLGKAGKGGIVTAYRNLGGPFWSVLGYLGILIGFVVLSFYSVVGGWCLMYLFESIVGFSASTPQALGSLFGELSSSPSISVCAQVGFLALVGFVVAFGIRGGIELCSKILMPLLFIFMCILIVTGLCQPGAWKGVEYLFMPDFLKFSWKALLDAMGLVFFSYSVGAGCMVTYGAYIDKKTDLISSTFWIVTLSLLISLMAGLMILPANFAFGMDPAAGPGLTFITMPAIFSMLPAGQFFAIVFFCCLVVAALTSAVSMLEIDITWMVQELKLSRPVAVAVCLIFMLILSVPCALSFGVLADVKFFGKTVFDSADFLVSNLGLPIGGIIACMLCAWTAWDRVHTEWTTIAACPTRVKIMRLIIGVFCPALVLAVLISGLIN
ncbi:sodium-dependent transporter [uncultured Parasutterella sp.]|uniref:sodium-dependent transporter n=1 Tax=uncultured Parasutterella sp. TaxID=1263098 RepID=UPI00259966BF|nr:sodium-dependent transporter [uncultured Parasutterella sp.]